MKKIQMCLGQLKYGLLLLLVGGPVLGEVRLPALFSDHMVLQGGEPVPIWGWAVPGEQVAVEIGGQTLTATADAQGDWRVDLAPLQTGAKLTLTVQAANLITIRDVLVGEVWLGSGQSNMGLRVSGANNFAGEQARAELPELRMFTVASKASPTPLGDCRGKWQVCEAQSVGNFSAALYFFGRELQEHLHVPVGLIHASWGGTPIQPWMPLDVVQAYPGYAALLERKKRELAVWPAREKAIQADLKAWEIQAAAAKAAHTLEPPKPWNPGPPDAGQYMPAQLYNAMIHPLIPYRLRGAIWYQGEANAGGGAAGAADYTDLQSRLIAGWRRDWGRGDFPFYYVQLPNWNNDGDRSGNSWAYFREGQENILQVPNTGMAVTLDIGEADNIHPKNKQEAGRRLALLALAGTYHQPVVCEGPQFDHCTTNGAEIAIWFTHADGGLVARNGDLRGFGIAGADKQWYPAVARIAGTAVLVSASGVPAPAAVRYGWANNPVVNLYNGAGLPARPFRTDR